MRLHLVALAALAGAVLAAAPAFAADKLTLAITGIYAWDSSPAVYGKKLGFFSEAGIDLDVASTENGNDNVKAVIGGSADIGVASTPVFIGAVVQGAPLKMIASVFKGYPDYLWYVRADSKLQSLKDVTPETTFGVSSLGSSSYIALSALLGQYGLQGKFVATGASSATMTQVMSGQIDVGTDGNGLLGIPEWNSKEIRVLAYGRELTSLAGVTVRGVIARKETVETRRDVLVRFLQAFQKTIDWMYSHPEAVQWFADQTQSTLPEAQRVVDNSYPQAALNVGAVTGIDISVKQGIELKRIPRQPTQEEVAGMFDSVWAP